MVACQQEVKSNFVGENTYYKIKQEVGQKQSNKQQSTEAMKNYTFMIIYKNFKWRDIRYQIY